ncbi:MAG: hypothetical protein IT364_20590 [Candidatus Hydrogenedentes bacterium]|nr:hypothetical protein [Candidatus Hydrogenedentota bacterium]
MVAPRPFRVILVLGLLAVSAAFGQSDRPDAPSSILDTVSKWLTILGEKTEDFIAPRFGRLDKSGGVDWTGLSMAARDFDMSYPVKADGTVSIASEFGEIRVATWDNPVVQVRAKISAGAESVEVADELIDAIEVDVKEFPERLEVRTKYPDTRNRGKVAIAVNYTVTVPVGVNLLCNNNFGDTVVAGIKGSAGVESLFGLVDLRDISGPVRVRAIGEFPLHASGLRQGGSFELRGSQAEFSSVAGDLKVGNFMGAVSVRELAPECSVDVTSESGPIHLYLPENSKPDVAATVQYGTIQPDVSMDQSAQGALAYAKMVNMESKQRVSLHASFDNIYIHQEGLKPTPAPPSRSGGEYVTRGLEESAEVAEGMQVSIKAILGDVRIEGSDSNQLQVKATKVVRVQSQANAEAAIEALNLRLEPLDGKLFITTAVRDNMAALGCTHYRVDLEIKCPRSVALKIRAENGFTSIAGMGSGIEAEQVKGAIAVEHCKRDAGPFDIGNQAGDVTVTDCQGPLTITAQQGATKTVNVYGKQTISGVEGKTIVESPKGEVFIRNRGGDISILALDGVQGEYNVQVERGNLNFVIPPTADASLWVTARNGEVDSAVPLTGNIVRGSRKYNGQLNGGQFRVELTAENGDIYIDGPADTSAS